MPAGSVGGVSMTKSNHLKAGLFIAVAFATTAPALAQDAPPAPKFIDESASSGLNTPYDGEWFFMVGGGIAAFDCNGDSYADMLLPGGASPSQFYVNTSTRGGALTFAPQLSGIEMTDVAGAYPADIDSDGITDLLVIRVGENVAMRGLGECGFERANEAWSFEGGDAWSAALAATWERGAAWPTVAVGNYIDREEEISPWGSCTPNWLHRPGPAGGFAEPLPLTPSFCPLSMLFTDWNRSGTPSLRVSNDREYYEGGQEQMWTLAPGADPVLLTPADGWKALRIWGMGIASTDLDGDSYPEYFLTSMADNKLQTLAAVPTDGSAPKPSYADVAWPKGVTAHRPYTGDDLKPSTGWHTQFEDVNNDGLADLFIAKGNVWDMPDFAMKDPNNLLLQQSDGKFTEAGDKAGVASVEQARGAALADFNLDGLVDMVVVNRNSPAQIWRNTSANAGHWIELKIEQPGPNRDAVGAWIEIRCEGIPVMRLEATVGGGHAGGQAGWRHFGLGEVSAAEVRVIWPDGTSDDWQPVDAGSFYILKRGEPPRAFDPA
jgi:hypothetical protein